MKTPSLLTRSALLAGSALASLSATGLAQTPIQISNSESLAAGVPMACFSSIRDAATGDCLTASSMPTLGQLFPLSSAFFIDPTGRVGIGTTSPDPSSQLDVDGSIQCQDLFSLGNLAAVGDINTANLSASGIIQADTLQVATQVSTGALSVTNGATVGSDLGVGGDLGAATVTPEYGGPTTPTLRFGDGSEASGLSSPSAESVAILTDGTERVRVDSSGNLGIGTSTPSANLHVAGNSIMDGRLSIGAPIFGNGKLVVRNDENYAIYGENNAASGGGFTAGVYGYKINTNAGGFGAGVWGRSDDPNSEAVFAEGDFTATGVKAFAQPHPSDPSKQINFVCLEGNESGTYFRGKTRLVAGRALIDVPEDFRLVSDAEDLTVQLTKVGRGDVWVEAYDLNTIEIAGERDLEVHYIVNGVRRGFRDVQTIRSNVAFRPRTRGEAFGAQYTEGVQQILIESGVLNPDLTPNEVTASQLGWQLSDAPGLDLAAQASPVAPEREAAAPANGRIDISRKR